MASEGPCQLRFDYIYFSMLELRGVREILSGLRCSRHAQPVQAHGPYVTTTDAYNIIK